MKNLILTTLITIFGFSFANCQLVNIQSNTSNTLEKVDINESLGICIAAGVHFVKSIDNGNTWINNSNSNYLTNIFKVTGAEIITSNIYILTHNIDGSAGEISKTIDGGLTWQNVYLNNNEHFNDLAYNGSIVLAVGNNGIIKKSSDLGNTWINVSSSTNSNLNSIEWDLNQNKWVIGGDNIRVKSTNSSGTNWNIENVNYRINDLNFKNGILTEVRHFTNYATIVKFDNNGVVINEINSNYLEFQESIYISNSNVITHDRGYIYNIEDQLPIPNGHQIDGNLIELTNSTNVEIRDIDFGTNYAIVVGVDGGLAKLNFNGITIYKPISNFNLSSVENCAGEQVSAFLEFDGYDSIEWSIDGQVVSIQETLTFLQPSSPGSHTVSVKTFYNGIISSSFLNILTKYPPTLNDIIIEVDTSICINEQLKFIFPNIVNQDIDIYVQIKKNGLIVFGPILMPQQGYFSMPSFSLISSQNIVLQFFTSNECDTTFITHNYTIEVIDYNSFSLINYDPGVCNRVSNLNFQIDSTIENASYTFSFKYSKINEYNNPPWYSYNFTGLGNETMDINIPTNQLNYNGSNYNDLDNSLEYDDYEDTSYHNYINMDFQFHGCIVQNIHLFEFDITNTDANFALIQHSTNIGDTIRLANLIDNDYHHWSITPSVSISLDTNTSSPIFIPQVGGEYTIQLIAESRFGCLDTVKYTHIIADKFETDTSHLICFTDSLSRIKILGTKISAKGNYFEYGYYTQDLYTYHHGNFVLRKISPSGELLWEKILNNPNNLAFISTIEIDNDENVYGMINVRGMINYELINQNINNESAVYNYLVKWDVNGNMVKVKETGYELGCSVLCHDNKIYVLTINNLTTFNSNFDIISTTDIEENYTFGFNLPIGGSNPYSYNDWHWDNKTIKMKLLLNGNIAIVGEHPNSIYCKIFKPGIGFINNKNILSSNYGVKLSDFTIDLNNNIYILADLSYNNQAAYGVHNVQILDSIFEVNSSFNLSNSYIIKIDSLLNKQWIKESSIKDGAIDHGKLTNEIVISGLSYSDFYFGGGDSFYRTDNHNLQSSIDFPQNPLGLIYYEPTCFIISLDGELTKLLQFGKENNYFYGSFKNCTSVCGDIYLTSNSPINYNGEFYDQSKNYILKLPINSNCEQECDFIFLNSDPSINFYCSSDTNFQIPIYTSNSFDSVGYNTFQNGTLISTGFFQIEGNSILGHMPNMETEYQINLYNPLNSSLIESISILVHETVNPLNISELYANCSDDNIVVNVDTVIFHDITWTVPGNFVHHLDSMTIVDFGYNVVDSLLNYFVVATDNNNCLTTSNFAVHYTCMPTFIFDFNNLICTNSTSFEFNYQLSNNNFVPNNFESIVLQNGQEVGSFQYPINGNTVYAYLPELNVQYEVILIDSYNQTIIDTFDIMLVMPNNNIILEDTFELDCDRNLIISIDSNQFENVSWSFDCCVPTLNQLNQLNFSNSEYIGFSNMIPGSTHLFTINANDLNNCNVSDSYIINYCNDLSIRELDYNSIQLYPNPVTDFFELKTNLDLSNLDFIIYDSKLKEVNIDFSIVQNKIVFNSKELTAGYYLLKIVSKNEFIKYIPFIKISV